jgi:hypothetical protein
MGHIGPVHNITSYINKIHFNNNFASMAVSNNFSLSFIGKDKIILILAY